MKKVTVIYFVLSCLILIAFHGYYPKWKQTKTEATLSWDTSGYYMYLPAIFIYKDLKKCSFKDEVLQKYQPTYDFQQAFIHEPSGNCVMKYPIGQALQMAPFFGIAHIWANNSEIYPADGFSFPYQFTIGISGLLIAFIGLFFSYKILNEYFNPHIAGITILSIILGSNYLEYSAITGSMTHNHLYTINAIIIWLTINFYKKPSYLIAIGIGLLVGLAALTRPTEILIALIPILWNVNIFDITSIKNRFNTLQSNLGMYVLALVTTVLVGFIQLAYWKYVTGDWIVYSYEDQGFSWLSPHILNGLFSSKSGWLRYSPFMIYSLIGFYFLKRKSVSLYAPILFYMIIFMYVTFAWDIWWYGGSLGQRAMVQSYPALLFPLAAFFSSFKYFNKVVKGILSLIMLLFIYINIWWVIQAHNSGAFMAEQTTNKYYWRVLGRWKKDDEAIKLLDAKDLYDGQMKNYEPVGEEIINNIKLDQQTQFSPKIIIKSISPDKDWLRIYADYLMPQKEWNVWNMTQLSVKFLNHDQIVKHDYLRIPRLLKSNKKNRIHFDTKMPSTYFNKIEVLFYNADSSKEIFIENIEIGAFDEM